MQALYVGRQRVDILVAQLGGDGAHDHGVAVVGAFAFAERGQLLLDVVGMLPTQVWKTGSSVARAVGRVASVHAGMP